MRTRQSSLRQDIPPVRLRLQNNGGSLWRIGKRNDRRRWRTARLGLVLIASFLLSGCSFPGLTPASPRTIREIRNLSSALNGAPAPAHISGVVTYWDPDWRLAFVQDATGGLKVPTSTLGDLTPRVGQRIEIDARVSVGGELPVLVDSSIRLGSEAAKLTPLAIRLSGLRARGHDCELVRVEGAAFRPG